MGIHAVIVYFTLCLSICAIVFMWIVSFKIIIIIIVIIIIIIIIIIISVKRDVLRFCKYAFFNI